MNYWTNSKALSVDNLNEFGDEVISAANEWKYLGSTTGTTAINLPSDFNELYIEVYESTVTNFEFNIPKIALSSTAKDYKNGHFISENYNNSAVSLSVSSTQAQLSYLYAVGSDISSNATVKVYYR